MNIDIYQDMGNSIIADDIKKTPGTPWRENQNGGHLAKIAKVETSSTVSNYKDDTKITFKNLNNTYSQKYFFLILVKPL